MILQGLEGTLLSNSPTRQTSPPPAVFSEAAWLCTSLDLGGGRNGSPARYVLLRTQSPLPPSSARTLLTLVSHRLHSSAPFVIIHPLFRFLAATTRPSFHSGSQRSHSAPKNCTTTTNHIRPYSSIVPPPIYQRSSDWAISDTLTTHEFPCIIVTSAVLKSHYSEFAYRKSMELGRYHT